MRIDALMCCVGQEYAKYLGSSIQLWLDTLDSLTVVTRVNDVHTLDVLNDYQSDNSNLRIVETDLFNSLGASFNKGAALVHAFSFIKPTDWFLSLDADIIPESTWRKRVEKILHPTYLWGAARHNEQGNVIHDPPPFPYGYFQCWNVANPITWYRPLWDVDWSHAGHYEMSFIERWPEDRKRALPIRLTHYGEVRANWFADSRDSQKRMKELRRRGFHKDRHANNNRITIPAPTVVNEIIPKESGLSSVLERLHFHSDSNPFRYIYRALTDIHRMPVV